MTVGGLTNYGTIQNYSIEPYISVASFRAAPTWLDTNDLIPGGVQTKQDDELYNALLRATSWCDITTGGATEQPYIGASNVTENMRVRSNRWGEISIHAKKNPVQYVSSIMVGANPLALQEVQNITQLWIEDNAQIIIPVPGFGNFTNLQFGGGGGGPSSVNYVWLQYAAGYFNSTLAAGTYALGTSSVTMNNPVGLIPGTTFRINDPSQEEICTVAPSYTPGAAVVPLTTPLIYTHTSSSYTTPSALVGASAIPMLVQQACIAYAVGLLLREDTSSQAPFAGTPFGPSTRRAAAGGKSAGLISDAEGYLKDFGRVR
jgi:hypothetical protein